MQKPSLIIILCVLFLAACGGGTTTQEATEATEVPANTAPAESDAPTAAAPTEATTAQRYPDIVDAELTRNDDGTYDIAVTVSSPYDTPERYADGWRVVAPDGSVLGERPLLHDHANEQPFTRSLNGFTIPAEITTVTIEGRDKEYGYGGQTLEITVPTE